MTQQFADPQSVMQRALELAQRGRGHVEPNPPVGAVIVDDDLRLVAEGYHEQFGGPHAEINALKQAGQQAQGNTLYVTLEPCCHQGKTGPCTQAVVAAGISRVVIGAIDPSPEVSGGGIVELRDAGLEVETGLLRSEAERLIAGFVKRVTQGLPYVHAKWAMTLDGKIASRTGASRWISNESSRRIVHALRGRMDAIVVGSATARVDDPLLTARPAGPRIAVRVVVDSNADLPLDSQLVVTATESPVLVVAAGSAPEENVARLTEAGVEVLQLGPSSEKEASVQTDRPDLLSLLRELTDRGMTNVLVEGGSQLLGSFFDRNLVDEVHVFLAPKIVGGVSAVSAVSGTGLEAIPQLAQLEPMEIEMLDGDVYVHGPLRTSE